MSQPRYQKYVDKIAEKIISGELKPGTRLAPHRIFAKQEGISLVTASRVYRELIDKGLVSGETGRGTFVRDIQLLPTLSIQHDVVPEMLDLNFSYPIAKEQTKILRESLRELVVGGDLEGILYYQQHTGRHHERVIAANYLMQQGFSNVSPETLTFVSGAQHGLATIVLGMFSPGDIVAVDALTYPGFKALAKLYHIDLVAIPALNDGPDLKALDLLCQNRNVRAYYTMPTLHNPLGWVMPLSSRKILSGMAKKHDFLLIEDGSYAFLHRPVITPLAMLAPERTFYIAGFSKNVATGLRVGIVLSPKQYIDNIEKIIRITTWNTPALTTAIICDWLVKGEVAKIERNKRQDAKNRQKIVRQIFGDFPYIAHPNSYFIWVPLPEGLRSEAVVSQLSKHNVAVSSAGSYSTSIAVPQAIRVAVSTVPYEDLAAALETIKSVILYMIDLE